MIMKKTVNLTVRIDEGLKLDAEKACQYLGVSFTSEIHNLLRGLVRDYALKRAKETEMIRTFMEGEACLVAYAALCEKMQAEGQELPEYVHEVLRRRAGIDA